MPSVVEQAAANDGGRRHRVTTAVDGAAHGGCHAFEDGANLKVGVGGELPLHVAMKLGDKNCALAGPGWETLWWCPWPVAPVHLPAG